jgi:hypothetical protein
MKQLLILITSLLIASCNDSPSATDKISAIHAIQHVMDEQQAYWNRGDIEGFMQGYWQHDSLRFIGKRGITLGWQPTLDNYKKSYPGTENMGRLKFTNLSMEMTGDSSVYVIGKWELFRIADTLSGHYSLLWKNLDGNWLIVADHSS